MDTTNLIDIHNHSLPFVDDGTTSYDEAINNIEYLYALGYTDIILTSHYIIDSKYTKTVSERKKILKNLQKKLKIPVNLYIGNELFVASSDEIKKLLKLKKIACLNESKYLLIEFPMSGRINHIESIICELNEMGITPIIAHPERYRVFQNDYKKIDNLLEYDCLLQCNLTSYIGHYGKKAKKVIKLLLKEDKVNFLATDLHHISSKNKISKALLKLSKKLPQEQFTKITMLNQQKVLTNDVINLK